MGWHLNKTGYQLDPPPKWLVLLFPAALKIARQLGGTASITSITNVFLVTQRVCVWLTRFPHVGHSSNYFLALWRRGLGKTILCWNSPGSDCGASLSRVHWTFRECWNLIPPLLQPGASILGFVLRINSCHECLVAIAWRVTPAV